MSKHIQSFNAQRVTYTTSRAYDDVLAHLDEAVNRLPKGVDDLINSKGKFEDVVKSKLGPSGFMFVSLSYV